MIVITLGIITELSKSRTAHGGCAPLDLFDDREAWRRGGVLFVDLGKKNEHHAKSRNRSRTKSFEVKSEQIQQLLSEEELGGGGSAPPPTPRRGGCAPRDLQYYYDYY